MKATRVCSVDGCIRDARARGVCSKHYQRARKLDGFEPRAVYASAADRLTAGLVRMPNGCLEWTGRTDRKGYGLISVDGKNVAAHRFAWKLANGPIPDGLNVLHHCDNPPCCDAEKCLFLGTIADNNRDMVAKGRSRGQNITHCPQGHEYTEANTYVWRGRRKCRTCGIAYTARWLKESRAS